MESVLKWVAPCNFFREGLSTSLEAVVSAVSSMRDAKASDPIDSAVANGATLAKIQND